MPPETYLKRAQSIEIKRSPEQIHLDSFNSEVGIKNPDSEAEELLHKIIAGDPLTNILNKLSFDFPLRITRGAELKRESDILIFSGGRAWERNGNRVIAGLCDPNITYTDLILENTNIRGKGKPETPKILPSGERISLENIEPIGAYTPDTLKSKINNTERARQIAQENQIDVVIPTWVASAKFKYGEGQEMAAGVYSLPKGTKSILDLDEIDDTEAFKVTEKLSGVVKKYAMADFIHPQLHAGNTFYFVDDNGEYQIIITDWEDAYDISEYPDDSKLLAREQMIGKFFNNIARKAIKSSTLHEVEEGNNDIREFLDVIQESTIINSLPYMRAYYPTISINKLLEFIKNLDLMQTQRAYLIFTIEEFEKKHDLINMEEFFRDMVIVGFPKFITFQLAKEIVNPKTLSRGKKRRKR